MRRLIVAATLSVGVAFAAAAFADADPTMDQIYQAEQSGHPEQAQTMITQVLADHPGSAKAHYVQAELYAKAGKASLARTELATAEKINPGLSSFSPRSVQELKAQLGLIPRNTYAPNTAIRGEAAPVHFPWGTVLILAIVVGVLFMLFRRRQPMGQYPVGSSSGMGGAPGGGYGPGYGPAPMGGGGMGSGIAGGLASGLAVGAGVVAGEELAHHFMDGGRRDGGVIPSAEASDQGFGNNSDMGGSDFGSTSGGGWDDGGGSGGGGGDDWS